MNSKFTLKQWGEKVRNGYQMTEEDIKSIIPGADRFKKEYLAEWTEEKKNFHDHGFIRFIGCIGTAPEKRKAKTADLEALILEKLSKEVGEKYAQEHSEEKVIAKDIVAQVIANVGSGKSSYITGDTGVGKTHTLISIILHLARFFGSLNDIKYYYYGDLFKILQKNGKYDKAKIMIIDDLCEPPASWFEGLLETFIEDVYRSGSILIITSNVKMYDYKVKRISSRIKALCQEYEIEGEDLRVPSWKNF